VVGDADTGKKLVLVLNDGAVPCIAHQPLVLNLATEPPVAVAGDLVAGGQAEDDVLDPGVSVVSL
jgi:hypothetical protein